MQQLNHPAGVGAGDPKIQPDRNVGCTLFAAQIEWGQGKGCTSFVARVLLSMPSLEELSKSFFELSLGVAPDLGRWVSFATMVAEGRRTPKPGFPASADTTCLTRKQRAQKLYGTTTAWTPPRCAYTRLEMRERLYWKGEGM